jgi:hypothetical protein
MHTVDLYRLKAVVTRLLDEAIRDHGSAEFKLDDNFYWTFDPVKQFDMSSKPIAEEVGSLHDDWKMTHWLADEPARVSSLSLTEVAPLLAYIGNKLAQRREQQDKN